MRTRRFDPSRRDRIIEATLGLIAEQGVAGATYRKIAIKADIPLGSLTYHFSGVDDLLDAVFSRFIERSAASYLDRFSEVHEGEPAGPVILEMIGAGGLAGHPHQLVLSAELQALAMRKPEWRKLYQSLMATKARSLEKHYDPLTAALIEVVMDGLASRIALDPSSTTGQLAVEALQRLIPPRPGSGPAGSGKASAPRHSDA